MNVTDDEAVPESFHCIAKDVSADRLHDVLNEFRSVGFDAFPFLCGSYTFIGDRFSAVLIFTDSGLHIGEQTTGGEFDEEQEAKEGVLQYLTEAGVEISDEAEEYLKAL